MEMYGFPPLFHNPFPNMSKSEYYLQARYTSRRQLDDSGNLFIQISPNYQVNFAEYENILNQYLLLCIDYWTMYFENAN